MSPTADFGTPTAAARQSPAGKTGDMIFCMLITSINALMLCTRHVNLPLSASALTPPSTMAMLPAPLPVQPLLASGISRTNAHSSFRSRMSADTTMASLMQKPPSLSIIGGAGVKSHQPCDFFFGENRCHESRIIDFSGSSWFSTHRR